jgi:uncharacterized protein with ATP-grasp and redox domains
MTSEPGSFARACVLERKPQIIRRVIADNNFPPETLAGLAALRDEIAYHPMQPIRETAPDTADWNAALAAYSGKTWLEVPWYFAEAFFYRKLLEVTGYFRSGNWQGQDPFHTQKISQMQADLRQLAPLCAPLFSLEQDALFEGLLHSCLWGNRADLSNYTVKVKAQSGLATRQEKQFILIDHTEALHQLLAAGLDRLDFINDNTGSELFFDLALADFLLQAGWVQEIHLHLKNQPFFVSDAMPADVRSTIDCLKAAPEAVLRALGGRLADETAAGQLYLETDPFWTGPLMFRQMPPSLRAQIAQADLVLLKGDVNYRRLLDDAHWPFTTRLEQVSAYFPAPFAVLRTLKGEILVGLAPGQAQAIQAEDPEWLLNGKRGLIHFVTK